MEGETITRDYIRNFFQLSDSEQDASLLDYIMSHLKSEEYEHHSFICRTGDEANEMFFIESGSIFVLDKDGEVNNELQPGRYFGEYAAITGDKRMADIQAHGVVRVFTLDKETLLYLTRQHPEIYGLFLRNIYTQSSEKYRKLVKLLNINRGIDSGAPKKKMSMRHLVVNYSLVLLVFLAAIIFASTPESGQIHPFWLCSPVILMVAYTILTHHAHEALIISTMLVMILLSRFHFMGKFTEYLHYATSGVADIILIILLMGSLTRLFSASGSINALKDLVHRKIKSVNGTLFAGFLSMVLIALDEYLSIMINNASFRPCLDEKNVPREKSAIVMGMTPSALCILSPFSVMGIYLTGVITLYTGENGIFLESIRYNYGAFFSILFILLLVIGKLPLFGGLKQAQIRVKEGGCIWPEGTDTNEGDEEQALGRLFNLFLPVFVFIVSSIVMGTLAAGVFQVNVLYGMLITLVFTFFLYCFQQYMTPDQFFKNIIYGIESMIGPVVVFIIGKCFAYGMNDLGFTAWLDSILHNFIGNQIWILAPIIFIACTLVAVLFNDFWAMYAICIPIAVSLAATFDKNIAIIIGAVCAAGFLGNELAHGNIHFIGSVLGVNPTYYYRAKRPYIIIITALTFCAFIFTGLLT